MENFNNAHNRMKQRAALKRFSLRASATATTIVNASSSSSSSCSSCSSSFSAPGSSDHRSTASHLAKCGVMLAPGMTDSEFDRVEAILGFAFPPDLRGFLAAALPVAAGFPDWRAAPPELLRQWIQAPAAAIAVRIAAGFWCPRAFGGAAPPAAPLDPAEAAALLRRISPPPPLVPIFGSFFIPAWPEKSGNPIFFVSIDHGIFPVGRLEEFLGRGFSPNWNHSTDDPDEEEEFRRRWSTSDLNVAAAMMLDRIDEEGVSIESWGRNLDALGGNVEILKRNHARNISPASCAILSSFSSKNRAVISNLVANFPVGFPGNRRIEFWSDVADKMMRSSPGASTSTGGIFADFLSLYQQVQVQHRRGASFSCLPTEASKKESKCTTEASSRESPYWGRASTSSTRTRKTGYIPTATATVATATDNSDSDKWVSNILDNVAARLRSGGWKEDEIVEMVESPKSVLKPHDLVGAFLSILDEDDEDDMLTISAIHHHQQTKRILI